VPLTPKHPLLEQVEEKPKFTWKMAVKTEVRTTKQQLEAKDVLPNINHKQANEKGRKNAVFRPW